MVEEELGDQSGIPVIPPRITFQSHGVVDLNGLLEQNVN
jgi:hypothetical protein